LRGPVNLGAVRTRVARLAERCRRENRVTLEDLVVGSFRLDSDADPPISMPRDRLRAVPRPAALDASSRAFSSGRRDAGCQAFAEAFARDDGIRRTRRAHTRNSPIVRAASRHRSQFAHRLGDDRSRDNEARAREPQGSASRLSIASGWVRDPCGVRGHPHSRKRLEQSSRHMETRKPVHLAVAVSLFRASRCPSEVTPATKLSSPATFP
jgi:hypothetical protein